MVPGKSDGIAAVFVLEESSLRIGHAGARNIVPGKMLGFHGRDCL